LYKSKAYRLFSFWSRIGGKEILVVATHGILKKTQKTPPNEIKKQKGLENNIWTTRIKKDKDDR